MTNERLTRLRTLAGSSIVGADLKWLLVEYDRLRSAAQEVIRPLAAIGNETGWKDGDETDRVYAWHEFKALREAVSEELHV